MERLSKGRVLVMRLSRALYEETTMKKLIASIFALALLGATAASAEDGIGAGVHVGPVGLHAGIGSDSRDYNRDRGYGHDRGYRHCSSWGWHHHHHDRYCNRYY